MQNYLSKNQLISLYQRGDLEGVRKQLLRYGKITHDKSFDIESGYYKGANRDINVMHHGLLWNFSMLNGEVRSLGYQIEH